MGKVRQAIRLARDTKRGTSDRKVPMDHGRRITRLLEDQMQNILRTSHATNTPTQPKLTYMPLWGLRGGCMLRPYEGLASENKRNLRNGTCGTCFCMALLLLLALLVSAAAAQEPIFTHTQVVTLSQQRQTVGIVSAMGKAFLAGGCISPCSPNVVRKD